MAKRRDPELFSMTFYAPDDRFPFKSIKMREICGDDEVTIGAWADQRLAFKGLSKKADKDRSVVDDALAQESVRISIVEVDGEAVNLNGVPFARMDQWSRRTLRFVGAAFRQLNGVEDDEVKKFLSGKPPTTEKETTTPTSGSPAPSAVEQSAG